MSKITCYKCKCDFVMPDDLYWSAKRSAKISFWCPYGHEQYYPEGETQEDKMRRERDRALQEQARLAQEADEQRARAERAEKKTKRLQKRVSAGVCPCCTRTFGNLQRHMATKHPEVVAANVVRLKA